MSAANWGALLGGVGLYVLGMRLLTDGLRNAAGPQLQGVLERQTRTPWRGLLWGTLVTGLVQSSGAVTVAAIGFANAGLLGLDAAVAIVLGTNIGTTATGWLVAMIGWDFDVEALALPLVGAGALLRMLQRNRRGEHLGEALAGFGLFFLGLDVLQGAFADVGAHMRFATPDVPRPLAIVVYTAAGVALAALLQSSSTAIALTMTAMAGGLVSLEPAAALVVGANVGTTTTAGLAALGATSNAKRVAVAQIGFNVLSAVVGAALLPWLLRATVALRDVFAFGAGSNDVATVALFHSLFNVAGVALAFPFVGAGTRALRRLFVTREEDEARPRHLDRNALRQPVSALLALTMELDRLGRLARRGAHAALVAGPAAAADAVARDRIIVERLVSAVGDYARALAQEPSPPAVGAALPHALRVSRHDAEVVELATMVLAGRPALDGVADRDSAAAIAAFRDAAARFLVALDDATLPSADVPAHLGALEAQYHAVKDALLRATTAGGVTVRGGVAALDVLSNIRRMIEQAAKAVRYSDDIRNGTMPQPAAGAAKENS